MLREIINKRQQHTTTVFLNKTYYGTKIQEILWDETNYKLIDTNIDNDIIKNYKNLQKTQRNIN